VQNKLTFGCEYNGEQQVKNIATPVKVCRIWSDPDAKACVSAESRGHHAKRVWLVMSLIGVMIVAVVGQWGFWHTRQTGSISSQTESSMDQGVIRSTSLLAIAVLPFANLSADADQSYFCDGITNDIITDLSKFKELRVTASYTVFKYKGQAI
jgi:adenylate cyclase